MLLSGVTQHSMTPPLHHSMSSSDHPVCSRQHIRRNCEANLLGSFQVDDHFKITGHFDWQILRFGPFENPIDVPGASPSQSVIVRTVVQKGAELGYCKRTTTA